MHFKWEIESFFFPSIRIFFHRYWQDTAGKGKGRGPFFIPLYHFHLLTNSQTFICNFPCQMTITFLITPFAFTRLLLMKLTTLSNCYLIDWCDVGCCLFACLLIWHENPVDSNSKTIILGLQANRLTIRAFSENQGTCFQFSRKDRKDIPQLIPLATRL